MALGQLYISLQHSNKLYVFSVASASNPTKPLFVGFDSLAAAVAMNQLKGNPALNVDDVYSVTVHSVHTSTMDAYNAASRIQRELCGDTQPPLNITAHYNRYQPVMCEQTGVIYRNASKACEALGIGAPRMSMHLARKAGHRRIKGLTFRYANHYDAERQQHANPAEEIAAAIAAGKVSG